jgi:adenylate cyclase class 2
MVKNTVEKEIKIQISDISELITLLSSLGAEFISREFQRTFLLDTTDSKLKSQGMFLRVRSGVPNTVTLKKKIKQDINVRERIEYETDVKDVKTMLTIFESLGFTNKRIMEKYRVNFAFNNTVVSVDEMPFGFYAEIEGNESDISEVVKLLKIDPDKKILITYWDIWEDYKNKNNVSGEDIIFSANYESTTFNINL